jgi:hypothetical protein
MFVIALFICLAFLFNATSAILAGEQIEHPRTPNISTNSIANKKTAHSTKDHPCLDASPPNPITKKQIQQSNPQQTNKHSKDVPQTLTIFGVRLN